MQNSQEKNLNRYTGLAISLHWIIALMVFLLIVLGLSMTDIPRGTDERSLYYNFHKSIGLTVGILMLMRNPPPALPKSIPAWQVRISKISHLLLYICLFVMPLSGFAATQFTKWGLKYFGLFKIPPLAFESKEIYQILQGIHQITGWILISIITLHILASLKHGIIDKDRVVERIVVPKD